MKLSVGMRKVNRTNRVAQHEGEQQQPRAGRKVCVRFPTTASRALKKMRCLSSISQPLALACRNAAGGRAPGEAENGAVIAKSSRQGVRQAQTTLVHVMTLSHGRMQPRRNTRTADGSASPCCSSSWSWMSLSKLREQAF